MNVCPQFSDTAGETYYHEGGREIYQKEMMLEFDTKTSKPWMEKDIL
jgi:hypothetical protein